MNDNDSSSSGEIETDSDEGVQGIEGVPGAILEYIDNYLPTFTGEQQIHLHSKLYSPKHPLASIEFCIIVKYNQTKKYKNTKSEYPLVPHTTVATCGRCTTPNRDFFTLYSSKEDNSNPDKPVVNYSTYELKSWMHLLILEHMKDI